MAFSPRAHDTLYIDGVVYSIAEHPAAPGLPYGQEGRAAVVYRLIAEDSPEIRALKVFKPRFQIPSLVGLSERLETFASLTGLQVCRRQVITARRNIDLVRQHPGLSYAVLMPWIDGPTWMEVLLEQRALSPEQSLTLARTLNEIFAGMEERGVAHCDLSGPNVLLPALADDGRWLTEDGRQLPRSQFGIELVDMEQMFGEDLKRPEFVPAGSSGYAHKSAAEGLWNARADRFAGALLIGEMLGWCDEIVRNASWSESYFDPEEMQEDTERYRLLHSTLRDRWGGEVAHLLEQAWESDSLADCPTFGQWVAAIPDHVPPSAIAVQSTPVQQVGTVIPDNVPPTPTPVVAASIPVGADASPAVSPNPIPKARDTGGLPQYIREMLDEARRFEESGNLDGALSTYREVLSMAPAGSGLAEEIPLIISQLSAKQPVDVPAPVTLPVPEPLPPAPPTASIQTPPAPEPYQPQPQMAPPIQQNVVPQPQTTRDEVFIPAQQARAPQAASSGSRSLPIVPVALVLALVIIAAIAFFLLQPKSGGVASVGTPTSVANVTSEVTASIENPTTEPTIAPTTAADNPTVVPTTQADNPTEAPTQATTDAPLSVSELATLIDNTDKVSGVAFSPDGTTLVSSSEDGTIKVWQTSDGKLIHIYSSHAGPLYSMAISPDSKSIAAGLASGSVVLWEANTGALLNTLGKSQYSVTKLAFSPDSKTGAIARVNGEITLVRISDGTVLATLKGTPAYVHSLAFSFDGATLYSASLENKVQAWKVADGTALDMPFGSETDSMALSPDGQSMVIGMKDSVEVWDVPSGQRKITITDISGDVKSVAFSPNGKVLAASADRTVTFFNVESGTLAATLQEHTAPVKGVAFSPDGQYFASGSDDKTVKVWTLSPTQAGQPTTGGLASESPTAVAENPLPTDTVEAPTPAAQTTAQPGGNTLSLTPAFTLTGHKDKVNGVAFGPDGQTFASASGDKTIKLWQASDGKEIRTLTNSARVYCLTYSPKSETLAAGFEDGSLKLWTVYDGVELASLDNGGLSVFSVAFSPDRQILAAGLVNGEINLWRTADNTLIRTLKGPPNFVYRLIFSADGSTLLAGSEKGEVTQWTVADGTLQNSTPSVEVESIALSEDGKYFADGFVSGSIEIWDAPNTQVLRTVNVFQGDVWSLAFSPDGKTLAAGSGDGSIKLLRVEDGAELATLAGHTATINGLAFSPDGKTLVSGSDDKTVRVWKVSIGSGN